MMGDRDYRQLIKNAIESIGRDIEPKIDDPKDNKTIYIHEVVRCLRRSYYDRTEPIEVTRTSFNNLMTGLLQKMEYGGKEGEYSIEDITLKGKADMIVDDAIIIFPFNFASSRYSICCRSIIPECMYVDIQKR